MKKQSADEVIVEKKFAGCPGKNWMEPKRRNFTRGYCIPRREGNNTVGLLMVRGRYFETPLAMGTSQ